jgi:TetR/AcrR family transcriptional regulator, repressor of fatR-cypB operon
MVKEAREDKRQAILDAALELFSELGFHGTTVPQVAERAGVAAGTIYRYFEGKEALVNALFQHWKGELGRALMNDFPTMRPVREQFHVFWRRMHRFATDHRTAFAFLELHHHAAYLDAKSREVEDTVLSAARAFFDATRRQQLTKDVSSELVIAMVWGAFSGVIKGSWIIQTELTETELDQAESCMWEAIRR